MISLTAVFAVAFALIHLFIGRLHFLDVVSRSRWLSAAGGVAVAYVFMHILPELSSHQQTFAEGLGRGEQAAEGWVYLVALAGLATFYGLEPAAKVSRGRSRTAGRADIAEAVGFLFAFLAGGVVLNVLKEELPEERQSRFWPFAIGAGAYAALLVAGG